MAYQQVGLLKIYRAMSSLTKDLLLRRMMMMESSQAISLLSKSRNTKAEVGSTDSANAINTLKNDEPAGVYSNPSNTE